MKKILLPILLMLLIVNPVNATESGSEIPGQWSVKLQTNTQAMAKAGVPLAKAVEMTRSMIRARFNDQDIVKAQNVVISACRQGLPPEPVISKAFEGMAKHAQPEKIVAAMHQVQSRYSFAFQQASRLSKNQSEQSRLGMAIAACLSAGMSQQDAAKIMGHLESKTNDTQPSQMHSLAMEAVMTARDMARHGVSSAHAADVVSKALEAGYMSQQMHSMRASFSEQCSHSSMEPDNLASRYANALHSGMSPENMGHTTMGEHNTMGETHQGFMGGYGDSSQGHGSVSGDHGGMGDQGAMGGHGGEGGGPGGGEGGGSGGGSGGGGCGR